MNDERNNEASRNGKVFSADYLAAKKDIDDAALNTRVLQALKRILPAGQEGEPLHVVELGGGIGTMLARLVERDLFAGPVIYRLTDNDTTLLATAKSYLTNWSKERNLALTWSEEQRGCLHTPTSDLTITLEELDLQRIADHLALRQNCDLILAHGVLDLFDFTQVLPPLFHCLEGTGIIYLTCNFDGETVFLPEHPADEQIIGYYHESMERRLHGASHTGRRLLGYLHNQQKEIMAAGSSDWIIHPGEHGYSDAQKLFLLAIIDMIALELAGKVEMVPEIAGWLRRRRQQVEDGSLFFLAKHLDVLACHRSL